MTHILQSTQQLWHDMTGDNNADAFGICSPILTVPYDTAILYMDVTIYDQGIALNDPNGKQVLYFFKSVDVTKPFNIGAITYEANTDFYYQHHATSDPFTTALGLEVRKSGGGWLAGDQFVMQWLFYFTRHDLITGIKSIRIY